MSQTLDLSNYATFTDPGFDNPDGLTSEYFTYSIDWGDGQTDEDMWVDNVAQGGPGTDTQGAVDATHIYDDPGVYLASLTVSDDDGGSDTVNFDITVVKPSMTISDGNEVHSIGLDEVYTLTLGQIDDPGDDAVQNCVVHWGDGLIDVYTAEQIAQNNQVTHTYKLEPGALDITVDVIDDSGTYTDTAESFSLDVNPFISDINELDFSAISQNYIHVANFGIAVPDGAFQVNNTPFEMQNELTAVIDMAGNATIRWQPSDSSVQRDDFTLSASCSYNSHYWTKSYLAHFATEDMPPVFSEHSMILTGGDGIGIGGTFAANAEPGSTITYSISGDYPENMTLDSETGAFYLAYTEADEFQIYKFDVTATDSGGSDTMHVVLPVNMQFVGHAAGIADGNASVEMNSSDNEIGLSADEQILESNPVLCIDSGPAHGSLNTEGAESSGSVFYTPAADFRGLDHFSYHWQYDLYNVYGQLIQEGALTNSATAYIQVGQICGLQSSGMTQVDGKYILGAGKTTTAAFTIDNPRGDEVPVSGVWSLNYDNTVIKVYVNGDEILPGKLNLVKDLTSSQQITLTITGVSGGDANISAAWKIWTDPEASLSQEFRIGGEQNLDMSTVSAHIETDAKLLEVHKEGFLDLAQAYLSVIGIIPTTAGQVEGKLQADSNMQIWADPEMTTLLIPAGGSATWDLYSSQAPTTVYVEGLTPGDSQLFWTAIVNGNELNTFLVNYDIIKIDIKKDGEIITGTTVDVVVGQKMSLTAEIQGLSPLFPKFYIWDIANGTAVKDYKQTLKKGYVVDLSNQDYYKQEFVFYWIAASDQKFQVELTGPIGLREDAWFNVLRPTATLTATPTSDNPPIDASDAGKGFGLSLHFGSWKNTTSPGITWDASVTTTLNGGGEIAFTQLFEADDHITYNDLQGSKKKRTTNGQYILDDPIIYGGSSVNLGANTTGHITRNDSPHSPLNGLKFISRDDSYNLYLMYKPINGIWVTLQILHWSWSGSATKDMQTEKWSCDSYSYFMEDTGSDTFNLPIWDNCKSNLQEMPDN